MTNRDRVYAAFTHQQPDRTPYMIGFTQKALTAMAERYGDGEWRTQIDNCATGVAASPAPEPW